MNKARPRQVIDIKTYGSYHVTFFPDEWYDLKYSKIYHR